MVTKHPPRSVGKRIALLSGERLHVGIDVHKATCHLTVWSETRGELTDWAAPSEPSALVRSLMPLCAQITRIVYEAGPTGFGLARTLRRANLPAEVMSPGHTPVPQINEPKCDRLDSRQLAWMSAKGLLRVIRVPTQREEAERQVLRLRQQTLRRLQRIKQQIRFFLLFHDLPEPDGLRHWSKASVRALGELMPREDLRFCLSEMLEGLEQADLAMQRTTRRLREIAQHAHHARAIEMLRTVPGVGLLTALTWRLEVPEPERFDNDRQVARLCGLAPRVRQSGQTCRTGPLMRSGNAWLRTALVEASWQWVQRDAQAQRVYRRLVSNTGSAKRAICAMARRLAIVLWRISVRKESYRVAA